MLADHALLHATVWQRTVNELTEEIERRRGGSGTEQLAALKTFASCVARSYHEVSIQLKKAA